ncbi:TPA: phage baseplate assembly protein, partial [Klebsiella quasipneumoniae subsp. quasipneumoniae]|nr:phage baseplate assembly protein [Klebsiella quasipneumoniae subsp. quasipneumoniae]
MWNQVDLRIRAALRGIRLAFRGRLTRVKSGLSIQQVQLKGLAGEQLQDAELFQHFGFTSCPPAGTQCIVLPIGGQTSHAIIIATENGAYRLQVASGEMAIYSEEGAYVHIKKGRIVETECDEYLVKAKKYTVQAEDYDVTATAGANFETPLLKASDKLADGKSTLDAIRETYDDHDHDHGG